MITHFFQFVGPTTGPHSLLGCFPLPVLYGLLEVRSDTFSTDFTLLFHSGNRMWPLRPLKAKLFTECVFFVLFVIFCYFFCGAYFLLQQRQYSFKNDKNIYFQQRKLKMLVLKTQHNDNKKY